MTRVIWHAHKGPILVFLWWGRGAWRWPHVERLCTRGQGYAHSEWRYKIGPFDGKVRW